MNDNMVERIARKLCMLDSEDPDGLATNEVASTSELTPGWLPYATEALEIIAIMKEPTTAMCKAVGGLPEENRFVWVSMIELALAETPNAV
jgi:hypothetical protein